MIERGGLLALTTLVLYAWLAPSHIVDGDNAEFATLGTLGGAAHPSGYPLYLLWLRALHWLPGSPAHAAALATCVLGAGVALVLVQACRAWGASPLGATAAVALFVTAPTVLRISTEAEVFALNNVVVATVLWLAAPAGPLTGRARSAALGLVAGLGLSNHMTCVLVAPVGLYGAVLGLRESGRPAATLATTAGALVLGLAPYMYLLVTPETPVSWGAVRSLGDLIAMVSRRDYGGPGAFLPTNEHPTVASHELALGFTLARAWLGIGLVAGLVMFVVRIRARATRMPWLLLLASWLLAGPLLVMKFNLEPSGLGLYVCQRFHVLAALLLAIPVACAIPAVGGRRLVALVATLGLVCAVAPTLPHMTRVHTPAVEEYAENLLRVLPERAVVFAGGDDEYLGLAYVQWALGVRQDVVVVAPQLVVFPWYAARIARRGIVAPAGEGEPIIRVIEHLLAEGRSVYVEPARVEVIRELPTYPFATLMRVLPRGAPTPALDTVLAENEAAYQRFAFSYPRPGHDSEFATVVHRRYASTWNVIARKARTLGLTAQAAHAEAIAAEVGPRE